MQDTAYNLHHISSDEQLLYEEYWSAGEEKDSKDEVTIWLPFVVNQMPFKTHVHDKGFLDHFAQLKHYINTKHLVCDIHSMFLGTYNEDCKFTCIDFFDFTKMVSTLHHV